MSGKNRKILLLPPMCCLELSHCYLFLPSDRSIKLVTSLQYVACCVAMLIHTFIMAASVEEFGGKNDGGFPLQVTIFRGKCQEFIFRIV